MAAVTVMDAAILTDEVRAEMFEASQRELDFNELEKCIADALTDVKREACLMTKLIAIATRSFLFGYYTALEEYQGIQAMLMDAAARGELEDNSAAQAACNKAEGRESNGYSDMEARG